VKNCIHYIGLLYDYEDTGLVTLEALEEEITSNRLLGRGYTREQYFDKRCSTNLYHFNHCPKCGAKIDWKAIKNKKGGEQE
jgi:hypothetical protein